MEPQTDLPQSGVPHKISLSTLRLIIKEEREKPAVMAFTQRTIISNLHTAVISVPSHAEVLYYKTKHRGACLKAFRQFRTLFLEQ